MKHKLLVALLALMLCATAVSAASNDMTFKVGLYPRLTGMGFDFSSVTGRNTSHFSAGLGVDFAACFKNGLGPYVLFNGQFTESDYGLVVGIAYNLKMNNNIDLFVTAGPAVKIQGKTTEVGLSTMCSFDFKMSDMLYARLGVGLNMYFASFYQNTSTTYFKLNIPLPSFALGWRF